MLRSCFKRIGWPALAVFIVLAAMLLVYMDVQWAQHQAQRELGGDATPAQAQP
ncbi:MAG: hypothetical protein WD042_06005 [Phycisphaeraceae bacterium]